MAELAAWLERIGLGRYADAFAEAAIDLDVLPDLSEAELADLGVRLGDRKRLLRAIAALKDDAGVPGAEGSGEEVPSRARPLAAERRQLTVMFVDLVGSTALSRRLDPEDMSAVMRAYHDRTAELVRRWGGHVAKYLGDGVLAYFGWPQAHEDDAERAVRAGLALADAIAEQDDGTGGRLALRVGIATGPVVVGELIGEGTAKEQAVVGETPNLAARLQALAQPGTVVISQTTRRLLGGLFELADLGPRRLRGFAEPLAVWRVEREAAAESRFEATRGRQLTALVGREHELGLLLDRWSRATDGEGQVVLLSGEPGIGKSRLIQALRERLRDQPHMPLPHYGSAHHTSSAFHPTIRHLERAASFTHDDPPDARLDKLETLLRPTSDDLAQAMALIAPLLSLDPGERYPPLDLTPQRRKQLTLEALVGQVDALARDRPVLAIYEDVHWFDPSSLDAVGLLLERAAGLRVLVLITYRSEFTPPWRGHGDLAHLSLTRLGRREGAAMVARLTGGRALPPEVEAELLARTDGIPLFVEELTKVVLESGLLDRAGNDYAFKGPLPPFAIPSSLHDSLMARLDRLAPVKEVAQIASVIGREFAYGLLARIAGRPPPAFDDALARLESAELIYRRGVPPEATYTFKHALVQDAAYQSLLKSRRQQLHARVAQALEECSPGVRDQTPEILAHHHTEAGLIESAVRLWLMAGRKAIERSAFKESARHLSKGLELLPRAADETGRLERELELRMALGPALIATMGFAAPEVGQTYSRARELCAMLGRHPQQFAALWGSWVFNTVRARLTEANELGHELLELARAAGDEDLVLQAHHALQTSLFWCGRPASTLEHMELGLQIYDPDRHRGHATSFGGHDPGACCMGFKALALWSSGAPDQAERTRQDAIALAHRLRQPASLAHVQQLSCRLHVFRRDVTAVLAEVEPLIDLADQHGFPHPLSVGRMARAWALGIRGDDEAGVAAFEEGLRFYEGAGSVLGRSIHLAMLAEILAQRGRHREAMHLLDQALEHVAWSGERVCEPELWRLRSDLLLVLAGSAGGGREAERGLRQAIALANEQGARMWELRAARDLARLWAERGERRQAHDLLAPVYGWFTEGFDTRDLKDARALLDQLG